MPNRSPQPAPASDARVIARRRPKLQFSLTGYLFIFMMLFMGAAAINLQSNLLFAVFGLMIGVLLVSGIVSLLVLKKLEVKRVVPESASVGQATTFSYEVLNRKRFWPSLSIFMGELDGDDAFTKPPVAYALHVAPKSKSTSATRVIPKRRGVHPFDRIQVGTSFPFGFIMRNNLRRSKETMLVFPAIARVDPKLLNLCRSAESSGAMLRPRRGGQDEFFGIKEFRNGENPRHISWRRSARTEQLVAKEMTLVAPPRLMLLVDTFLPSHSHDDHAAVEQTLAMAASLASHALEAELMVGLSAWSDPWLTLTPNRGKRHREDLMAALARLPLNMRHDADALMARAGNRSKSGTTLVLLTPRLAQLGLQDASRGHLIVLSPQSPEARGYFEFDPTIDFASCVPLDQEAKRAGFWKRHLSRATDQQAHERDAVAVGA